MTPIIKISMLAATLCPLSACGPVAIAVSLGGSGGGGGGGSAAVSSRPTNLRYDDVAPTYSTLGPITPNRATVEGGAVDSYSIEPKLPLGLKIDSETGDISGTPLEEIAPTDFTVRATNPSGAAITTLRITVRAQTFALGIGSTFEDRGSDMVALPDGSIVVTGHYDGTVIFGAGEPGETTLTSCGGSNIFLARYRYDGTLAWARAAGGCSIDRGTRLAVLPDGSILVAGAFQDTATFGEGEPRETTLVADSAKDDVFVARFEADGDLAWAKGLYGQGSDQVSGLAPFDDGSFLVLGYFGADLTLGRGEPNETMLTSSDLEDAFLASFAADGSFAFVHQVSGLEDQERPAAATLDEEFAAIAIHFDVEIEFDGNTFPSTSDQNVLVAKVRRDTGKPVWVRVAGGVDTDLAEVRDITPLDDGSFVVCGLYRGQLVLSGSHSIFSSTLSTFIARYLSDGDIDWVRSAESTIRSSPDNISHKPDGTLVVSGEFAGNVTFGSGEENPITLKSVGGPDAYVVQFAPDGSLLGAVSAGGPGTDGCHGNSALPDGSIAITGTFSGSITFDADSPGETTLQGDAASLDVFLARYRDNGRF